MKDRVQKCFSLRISLVVNTRKIHTRTDQIDIVVCITSEPVLLVSDPQFVHRLGNVQIHLGQTHERTLIITGKKFGVIVQNELACSVTVP